LQGQRCPLSRGGIRHATEEQHKAVAVAADGDVRRVAEVVVAGDGCRRRTPGRHAAREELGAPEHVEIDEDAAQRVRQEVRAQQPAVVDDGAPGLADAAGRGEAAGCQAAEHGRQHVLL